MIGKYFLPGKAHPNHQLLRGLTRSICAFHLHTSAALGTVADPDTAPASRVALYFHRACAIDTLRLRLRRHDPADAFPLPSSSPIDPYVAASVIRSAPSPEGALSLFRALRSHLTSSLTHHALHALAKQLASSHRSDDLRSLIAEIDAGAFPGIRLPSAMDRLRWYAAASDVNSAFGVWKHIRATAPASQHGHPCTESYNLVMGLCVDHGMEVEAVGTFRRMVEEGANPNSRTYTVIIDHLVRAGELDVALQVFDRLPLMRIRRTSRQYNVLAAGFSSVRRFDLLKPMIAEMKKDGILPGRAVRAAMVNMRAVGIVEGTEEFAEELSPDSRIGCVVTDGESSSDEEYDEHHERENVGGSSANGSGVQLKRWLDPSALASALSEWDEEEVKALESANLVWTSRLVCKILRGLKKADTAWKFFTWVAYQPGGFKHDHYTASRMVAILARSGHDGLVERLIDMVKREGFLLPFSTVRLLIDFYGVSKRPDAALRIYEEHSSICGNISNADAMLLCSSLLRTLTKCRRGHEAMDVLEDAVSDGILPDLQTFSGLMQFFAAEGDLRAAHKLFGMVRQCGMAPDSYMYQVLIRAYIKHNRTALALRMFEDMRNSGLVPDEQTKTLLVNSLWNEGKRREVAYVEEKCEEVREGLPIALAGHVWTVNSNNLTWAYNIYCNGIKKHIK